MSEQIDIQIVNEQPTLSFTDSSVVLSVEDSSSPSLAFTDSSVNLSIGDITTPSLTLNGGATSINLSVGTSNNEIQLVATGTPGAKGADGSGAGLNSEEVQDLVGAMFTSNTETNITVTYEDSDGTIDLVATDTNTTYSEATGSSEGLMSIAHHDKLDGIETGADVTDTTNVTAAGALMDSELTDLAGVKGVTISTLQVKPSEGAFENGDKDKLDGIATGATADQTNVSGSSGSCTGNAATATALATARAINGVNFDGTGDITVTAAGSTLSDTVTVAKGGTGATTFTSNQVLYGNGTSAIQDASGVTIDSNTIVKAQTGGFNGNLLLEKAYVDATSKSQGIKVFFGGTTGMTAGNVYFFNGIGWTAADADAANTSTELVGLALGDSSDTHGILLNGISMTSTDPGTAGDVLYLSTTAGRLTSTAPSGSGDIVRVMGYCLHSTSALIYFNPSSSWVEIS